VSVAVFIFAKATVVLPTKISVVVTNASPDSVIITIAVVGPDSSFLSVPVIVPCVTVAPTLSVISSDAIANVHSF